MTRPELDQQSEKIVQRASETETEDIGVRVVELCAELEDCDPTELPQLQETVDMDALERLLTESVSDRHLAVEFEYNDALISISSDRQILVQPLHP